ncbi:serine/threonine protein kinase [Mycobacterium sp. M1]|uniref:non-specific serine/threonine protein kinase n=1 Tax=Mycolicibacter acidiphilus TaxID=2835306 RepID=A0ABS5RJ01_9MYCO|nr:serine/threonine-protein kinase [Mycolicibacter acidiphilus]MBS9533558.1 serine/threonine protein kinase [Mycolicibacter acidiphilus]
MPLPTGATFAGYTIVDALGAGGMGEVYLAQHPRLPRRDALKVLAADVSADPEYRARFIREANLAATLFHPNIVGVHDRGEDRGRLWIAMDYVAGSDAARLLGDRFRGGLPVADVVEMVTAVAQALDYAHRHRLLHRDVKPANILLTDESARRILLADFGIARRLDAISGLTATNMTPGTIAYAAPEQLAGAPLDGRADQYALAATAFHLLAGRTRLSAAPPLLAATHPDLAALDPVLARALAEDPAERFDCCADFADALAKATASQRQHHPRATTVRRIPNWRLLAAAAVAALVFIAVGVTIGARPIAHTRTATVVAVVGAPSRLEAAPADMPFAAMRTFVTAYYALLPDQARQAWTHLAADYQEQNGLDSYLDFWSTVTTVTVTSVTPRDETSVQVELEYVEHGQTLTEARWLSMTVQNGTMLIRNSGIDG